MNDYPADEKKQSDEYVSSHWEAARDELRNLVNLPVNWDGEGADPFREELISPTFSLLLHSERCHFPPPSSIYLTASGTAMVEWQFANGYAVIANVREPNSAEIIYRYCDGRKPEFQCIELDDITKPIIVTPFRCDPPSCLDDEFYQLAA